MITEENVAQEQHASLHQNVGRMRFSKTMELIGEYSPKNALVIRELPPDMELILTPNEVHAIQGYLGLERFLCHKSRRQRLLDSAFSLVDRVNRSERVVIKELFTPGTLQRTLPEYGPRQQQRAFSSVQTFAEFNLKHPHGLISNQDALLYYKLSRQLIPSEDTAKYVFRPLGRRSLLTLSQYLYRKKLLEQPFEIREIYHGVSLKVLVFPASIVRLFPFLREETQSLILDLYDQKIEHLYEHHARSRIARRDLKELYILLKYAREEELALFCTRGLFLQLTAKESMHEYVRSGLYTKIVRFTKETFRAHKGPPLDQHVKECLRQTMYAAQEDPDLFVQGAMYVKIIGSYLRGKQAFAVASPSDEEREEVLLALSPLMQQPEAPVTQLEVVSSA